MERTLAVFLSLLVPLAACRSSDTAPATAGPPSDPPTTERPWRSAEQDSDPAATEALLERVRVVIEEPARLVDEHVAAEANHRFIRIVADAAGAELVLSHDASRMLERTQLALTCLATGDPRRSEHVIELEFVLDEMRRAMDAPASAPEAVGPEGSADPEGPWEYTIWFGTNRAMRRDADGAPAFGDTSEPDGRVHHGRCTVFIPKSHEIGSIGSGWFRRLWRGDDRLKLRDVGVLERDAWTRQIAAVFAANPPDQRDAVVYVHGYNNSFEDAAIRAAQIGFDLKVRGIMSFFSWPSRGSLEAYLTDESAVQASEKAIEEFLVRVTQLPSVGRVHVIAHSMGNVALARSMERIAERGAVRFGQIILAAPDVDAELFRRLAAAYPRIGERTTLYVSPKDKAVWMSSALRDRDRAGYSPPLVCLTGIDTVEVASMDLFDLGHDYFAEARAVLTDMFLLLTTGMPPDSRAGLRRAQDADGARYWTFQD